MKYTFTSEDYQEIVTHQPSRYKKCLETVDIPSDYVRLEAFNILQHHKCGIDYTIDKEGKQLICNKCGEKKTSDWLRWALASCKIKDYKYESRLP